MVASFRVEVVPQRSQFALFKPAATTLVGGWGGVKEKNGLFLRNNKMSAGSFKLNPVSSNCHK